MKITPPSTSPAPERGLFNTTERKRIRWLVFTFLLVAVSLVVMLRKENERLREEAELARAEQERDPELETVLVTPQIDVAKLESLVRDRTPGERSLIEPAALTQAFRDGRLINDRLFEPMGGRELDEPIATEIVAAPAQARGRLFRAHGWVEESTRYEAAGDLSAHTRGRLRLEQGGWTFFAVLSPPESGLAEGDFVRVDGLFVEVFRGERAAQGDWIEAPLLAGPRAVGSYPRLDPVTEIDPASFVDVTDDSIANGISGQPFYAYWELVSYSLHLEPGAVDWSQTPLLDGETMAALALDGTSFRAQPVRIPVSQIMGSRVLSQKDNPLRIEHLTDFWIGNEKWAGPSTANGVIWAHSPFDVGEVHRKDEVVANGFFLKHLAYEPRDGGIAIVPFFVLHSVQIHTPVVDKAWRRILIGFATGIALLGIVIYVMLLRDRRRSAELQQELIARRRARRRTQVSS